MSLRVASSTLRVGDSDYDLMNFSICDDCRYGIANFKLATVLFDLGTAAEPVLTADREYNPLVPSRFGFTFGQSLCSSTLFRLCLRRFLCCRWC